MGEGLLKGQDPEALDLYPPNHSVDNHRHLLSRHSFDRLSLYSILIHSFAIC